MGGWVVKDCVLFTGTFGRGASIRSVRNARLPRCQDAHASHVEQPRLATMSGSPSRAQTLYPNYLGTVSVSRETST